METLGLTLKEGKALLAGFGDVKAQAGNPGSFVRTAAAEVITWRFRLDHESLPRACTRSEAFAVG
jgi:hypothetical protein